MASKNVCFYFQVHQPYRLDHYQVFDIGAHNNYFAAAKNKAVFRKVAQKCYLPTNRLLLKLLKQHPEMRISFSLSGVFMEQCEQYGKDVLNSFKRLVDTGQVEILAETHYHSLSSLYDLEEFAEQIRQHRQKVQDLFGVTPKIFRNTELIYTDKIANFVGQLGFKGIIAEGIERVLGWRSPNYLYQIQQYDLTKEELAVAKHKRLAKPVERPALLLKNYQLSDDIAFRFSNQSWSQWPLDTEKFVNWVQAAPGETINLFMDFETFGEHQWEDTGIFAFLADLPQRLLSHGIGFRTPTETIQQLAVKDTVSMPEVVSWADLERDLSAWRGNDLQAEALKQIYGLGGLVKQMQRNHQLLDYLRGKKHAAVKADQDVLLKQWRLLQTSDHFYYMCTKYWQDGDVHKYFSPYDSPYDAFITYMNVLKDLRRRVAAISAK